MSASVDRILEILDVGLQDTTPAHYGYEIELTVAAPELTWHDISRFGVWGEFTITGRVDVER